MAGDPLLRAITAVCRKAREDAKVKQVHIASEIDVDQSTLARFERGEGWPRKPHSAGDYVSAYAKVLKLDAGDLLRSAVDLWETSETSQPEQRAAEAAQEEARHIREQRNKPPAKPAARRKPGAA